MKILSAKHTIIEQTAASIAAEWYEIGRGQGMTSKCKNAREYARKNFETWIPKALEILTDMLGRNDINDILKQQIYDAILERANDPELAFLDHLGPNPFRSKLHG